MFCVAWPMVSCRIETEGLLITIAWVASTFIVISQSTMTHDEGAIKTSSLNFAKFDQYYEGDMLTKSFGHQVNMIILITAGTPLPSEVVLSM